MTSKRTISLMKGRLKEYKKSIIETKMTEKECINIVGKLQTELDFLEDMKQNENDESGDLLYICPAIFSLKKIISDLNGHNSEIIDSHFTRNLNFYFGNAIKSLNHLENYKPK